MVRKVIYLVGILSVINFVLLIKAEPAPQKDDAKVYRTLGKTRCIYALTFSPDGKHLLAGEEHEPRYQIVDWDMEKKIAHRRNDSGHSGLIKSLCYSKTGDYFAIGHYDGFVSVQDRNGRRALSFQSIENLEAILELLSISEKPEPLVYTVVSFNIAQKRTIKSSHTSIYELADGPRIDCAAATRDGTTFVSCSSAALNVYHRSNFAARQELKSYKNLKRPTITHVAISDDSSTVMAYAYNDGLALFDVKNDKLIKKWRTRDDEPVYAIIPFHGRKWFATGNGAGEIEIWNEKGDLLSRLRVEDNNNLIAALSLTSDDCFLASAGENRPIVVWDLRTLIGKSSANAK